MERADSPLPNLHQSNALRTRMCRRWSIDDSPAPVWTCRSSAWAPGGPSTSSTPKRLSSVGVLWTSPGSWRVVAEYANASGTGPRGRGCDRCKDSRQRKHPSPGGWAEAYNMAKSQPRPHGDHGLVRGCCRDRQTAGQRCAWLDAVAARLYCAADRFPQRPVVSINSAWNYVKHERALRLITDSWRRFRRGRLFAGPPASAYCRAQSRGPSLWRGARRDQRRGRSARDRSAELVVRPSAQPTFVAAERRRAMAAGWCLSRASRRER